MGTLKEYQCNGCGYTITGTRKGRTLDAKGVVSWHIRNRNRQIIYYLYGQV